MCVCVSVCLSSTGQVTGLQRGPTTERWEYDNQGRIISRVFADGKTWSYTYLDKVEGDTSKARHTPTTVSRVTCTHITKYSITHTHTQAR